MLETGYHFPTYKRKIGCNTLPHPTSTYTFDLMPYLVIPDISNCGWGAVGYWKRYISFMRGS